MPLRSWRASCAGSADAAAAYTQKAVVDYLAQALLTMLPDGMVITGGAGIRGQMIRLAGFEAGLPNVELYAKAEWKNPGGSVKDRPAARMVLDGERAGALTKDKILLDATSGNTGIAYAMIGAARGYRVRLCVPANVTPERKRILQAFGAEIIYSPGDLGTNGSVKMATEIHRADPGLSFRVNRAPDLSQFAGDTFFISVAGGDVHDG